MVHINTIIPINSKVIQPSAAALRNKKFLAIVFFIPSEFIYVTFGNEYYIRRLKCIFFFSSRQMIISHRIPVYSY